LSETKLPAIPQPTADLKALLASVLALKEAVEILAGQRGGNNTDGGGGSAAALTRASVVASGTYEELRDKIVNGHG
jgi:hypothetical protein